MDFGEVLKRAGQITWRYKGLWVLGVLASCGRGNGGGGGGGSNFGTSFESPDSAFPQAEQFFQNINEGVLIAIVLGIIVFFLILALIFFILGIMGQAGLIHGVSEADEGEDVSLRSAFQGGLQHFWRLLGLNLLLIAAVIALVLVLLAYTIGTLGIGLLCLLPLLCLLIPLGIAFGVYIQLSQVAIVVESIDVFAGLRAAWELVKKEPGSVIAMGAILVIGGAMAGLLLAAPFIAIAVPAIGGIAIGSDPAIGIGIGLAVLSFLIYLPILIVLSGILQTYIHAAWTITYRRLTDRPGAELARS